MSIHRLRIYGERDPSAPDTYRISQATRAAGSIDIDLTEDQLLELTWEDGTVWTVLPDGLPELFPAMEDPQRSEAPGSPNGQPPGGPASASAATPASAPTPTDGLFILPLSIQ